MKIQSLFAGSAWMALLAVSALLAGCATRRSAVDARLHPAQFLENASAASAWDGTLEESQAAAAASWRF